MENANAPSYIVEFLADYTSQPQLEYIRFLHSFTGRELDIPSFNPHPFKLFMEITEKPFLPDSSIHRVQLDVDLVNIHAQKNALKNIERYMGEQFPGAGIDHWQPSTISLSGGRRRQTKKNKRQYPRKRRPTKPSRPSWP